MPSIRAVVVHELRLFRRLILKVFGFRLKWLAQFLLKEDFLGKPELPHRLISCIDSSPGYYIEIGANDGVAQSNTLFLEVYFGWEGLLIEPVLSTFRKLEVNRSRRRNFLLQAACVSTRYREPTVDLVYSNLVSSAIGLESDVRDPYSHAESGQKYLAPNDPIRIETARAMTLTRALELARAPKRIDLLSLDVEGAELEVLKGIDFQRYQIGWMLIESRDVDRIRDYLGDKGYLQEAQLSHHDFLFSLQAT